MRFMISIYFDSLLLTVDQRRCINENIKNLEAIYTLSDNEIVEMTFKIFFNHNYMVFLHFDVKIVNLYTSYF